MASSGWSIESAEAKEREGTYLTSFNSWSQVQMKAPRNAPMMMQIMMYPVHAMVSLRYSLYSSSPLRLHFHGGAWFSSSLPSLVQTHGVTACLTVVVHGQQHDEVRHGELHHVDERADDLALEELQLRGPRSSEMQWGDDGTALDQAWVTVNQRLFAPVVPWDVGWMAVPRD